MKRIFDRSLRYVPATATDVATTWRRFGFDAQANAERRARLLSSEERDRLGEVAELRELLVRVAAARQAA